MKQNMNSHLSRWLIAVLLLPPILLALFADNMLFFLFLMLAIGGLTWWEFAQHLFGAERRGLFILSLVGWCAVALGAFFYGLDGQQIGLIVALGLGAGYTLWALEKQSGPATINLLSRFALGHLYLSFFLSFFLLLKKMDQGAFWILYALLVTIAADTFAFYVGSKLKGPKLYPKASPNKTISGLLGGILGAMLVSAVALSFLPSEASLKGMIFLGFILGVWGALGDLFESSIKRCLEIKDTSTILMGHGGFWDRLDSLMFNLPPVYIYVSLWILAP